MNHFLAVVVCIERVRRVEIEKRPCIDALENAVTLAGVGLCFVAEVSRSLDEKAVLGILTYVLLLKNGDAWQGRLWRMCGLGGEGVEGIDFKHQT